jgi:hypothetical protein
MAWLNGHGDIVIIADLTKCLTNTIPTNGFKITLLSIDDTSTLVASGSHDGNIIRCWKINGGGGNVDITVPVTLQDMIVNIQFDTYSKLWICTVKGMVYVFNFETSVMDQVYHGDTDIGKTFGADILCGSDFMLITDMCHFRAYMFKHNSFQSILQLESFTHVGVYKNVVYSYNSTTLVTHEWNDHSFRRTGEYPRPGGPNSRIIGLTDLGFVTSAGEIYDLHKRTAPVYIVDFVDSALADYYSFPDYVVAVDRNASHFGMLQIYRSFETGNAHENGTIV